MELLLDQVFALESPTTGDLIFAVYGYCMAVALVRLLVVKSASNDATTKSLIVAALVAYFLGWLPMAPADGGIWISIGVVIATAIAAVGVCVFDINRQHRFAAYFSGVSMIVVLATMGSSRVILAFSAVLAALVGSLIERRRLASPSNGERA